MDSQRWQIGLYERMATIRAFEQTCLELSREGAIEGSIHLCAGQEAIPVGFAEVLTTADRVIATYRGHGWALACGVPLLDALAEVCHREGGTNGGRAGSALLSAPERGFIGENSIVGAGAPVGAGVALAAKRQKTGGVAVVSVGDGAMNQGNVHEAMAFASALALPFVLVCENNGWSEMTATSAMIRGALADRAIPFGFPSRQADGCDPVAVRDAAAWALEVARGGTPVLLEFQTVRLWGHYNRDIEHYRPKDDVAAAAVRDPLQLLRQRLLQAGLAAAELDGIDARVAEALAQARTKVLAMSEPDPATARDHVLAPPGVPADGHRGTPTVLTYQRAVNRALEAEIAEHEEVVVYGEDVGSAGGIFGVTRGLQKRYGAERVFDTPITESAILGSALGAAMQGMRPVVEIMWGDFLLVGLDQLVNQAANVRYLSRGAQSASLVVRVQQGAMPGSCAQHSQSLEAFLAHVPGLKVGVIATCEDAYAMTRAAVHDPDPCILIEARALYQTEGEVYLDAPLEAAGGARLRRDGTAAGIVTWGTMLGPVLEVADGLRSDGIDIAVLDLRWLNPLDHEAIDRLVERTGGRIAVVHEANRTAGFGAEVAAVVQERHYGRLAAPVLRLGAPDIRIPASPVLQRALLPRAPDIRGAVQRLIAG